MTVLCDMRGPITFDFTPIQQGAVEYADNISTEGRPHTSKSVLDIILNHLIARLQSWSSVECGALLHCDCSQAHSDLEW